MNIYAQTTMSHTIQRGETLESIANKYGITVADLQKANPDIEGAFYAGVKLTIPVASHKLQTTEVEQNNNSTKKDQQSDYAENVPKYNPNDDRTYTSEEDKIQCILDMQLGYLILDNDESKFYGDFPFSLRLSMGARYNVDETFGVDAMIGYSGIYKDCKTSLKNTLGNYSYHFITLPVRLNAKLVKDVSFYLGPRFEFMVAAKHEVGKESYNMSDMKKADKDFKTTYTYLDFGLKIKGFNVSYSFALDGKKKLCSGIINIGWGI